MRCVFDENTLFSSSALTALVAIAIAINATTTIALSSLRIGHDGSAASMQARAASRSLLEASWDRCRAPDWIHLNRAAVKKLILQQAISLTDSIHTNIVTVPRRTLDAPAD